MAFFKIGDTAHVRCDLSDDLIYYMDGHHGTTDTSYRDSVTSEMMRYAGSEVIIAQYSGAKYRISELSLEPIDFNWTDEMFQEYIERNEGCEVGSDDDISAFICS